MTSEADNHLINLNEKNSNDKSQFYMMWFFSKANQMNPFVCVQISSLEHRKDDFKAIHS